MPPPCFLHSSCPDRPASAFLGAGKISSPQFTTFLKKIWGRGSHLVSLAWDSVNSGRKCCLLPCSRLSCYMWNPWAPLVLSIRGCRNPCVEYLAVRMTAASPSLPLWVRGYPELHSGNSCNRPLFTSSSVSPVLHLPLARGVCGASEH